MLNFSSYLGLVKHITFPDSKLCFRKSRRNLIVRSFLKGHSAALNPSEKVNSRTKSGCLSSGN